MTAHPIDLVYVDGANVAKADVRGLVKLRERLRVADAAEVRSTKFSLQYGGLYVAALQEDFDLDAADTTTADDGINCIIDFDGNRFKKVADAATLSERTVTAAGTITVGASDDVILINKTVAASTTVLLPASSVRLAAGSKRVKIVDLAGNASSYPITISYFFTFTVTLGSPGVLTAVAHGLLNGAAVIPTTTGALPTGLTAGTTYYVVNKTTDTFQLAATVGGTPIVTSGSQSGVHTATAETIAGLSSFVIGSDKGSIELHPQPDSLGWYL